LDIGILTLRYQFMSVAGILRDEDALEKKIPQINCVDNYNRGDL